MRNDHTKRLAVYILVLLFTVTGVCGCAQLADGILTTCLMGTIHDMNLSAGLHYTTSEEYYMSGWPYTCSMNGVRIIKNVTDESVVNPAVPRFIFSNEQWYGLFYSEMSTAQTFREYVHQRDKRVMIRYRNVKTYELEELNFHADQFDSFNRDMKERITTVSVYDGNVVSYYSESEQTVFMVIVPDFSYDWIKELAYKGLSELKQIRGES